MDRRRKAGEGFDRLAREMNVSHGTILRAYDFANRDEAAAAAREGGSLPGRLTSGAMNHGPRNVSRGVRDCSWSLWRRQERAPQASGTEPSRGLRQQLSRGFW